MIVFIVCGLLSAVAMFAVMWRIDIQKFLGYPMACDVFGVLIFALIFHGTIMGMMVAVIGGLFLSAGIFFLRRMCGYKRLKLTRSKFGFNLKWHVYPAKYGKAV